MESVSKEVSSKLQSHVNFLKFKWDNLYSNKPFNKAFIIDCTIFLISILDNLILFVQDNIPKGSDKKSAVLLVVSDVFDHIISKGSPIWLQPLIPLIKEIVINIIIGQLIEFIVKKYKEGAWKKQTEENFPDEIQKSIIYFSRKVTF